MVPLGPTCTQGASSEARTSADLLLRRWNAPSSSRARPQRLGASLSPNAAHALQARDASIFSTKAQLLTAFVRHPTADNTDPQLLIVLQEPDTASRLLVYSLAAHQVQASLELRHTTPSELFATQDRRADLWPQLEAKCNDRYLVLSFAYPPSVHALSTSTLKYIQPPITDVASVASNRPPPISLSHRLLAFACTASDAVSPIRSDVRKMSNAAYHDPSRPYANAQADASGRVGEMRDNLSRPQLMSVMLPVASGAVS